MRVSRKVKIDDRWVLAPVPLDKSGRPDAKHVLRKGQLVPVSGGTFYLDHGRGRARKHVACGEDVDAVRRAMKTQSYVLELRASGMDVSDAPEIVSSRRTPDGSLREMAKRFRDEPPVAYTRKTISKYVNALTTFADWAASAAIFAPAEVDKRTITRWIAYLQKSGLDASTIVPKVRIVVGELKRRGVEIRLEERSLPRVAERERYIYSAAELEALMRACNLEEYELFQVFLLTGMRFREVAYLAWNDVDPVRCTIRVSRKRDLGFMPKAYHERTIPVPLVLVQMLQQRGERLVSDGAGLIFPTSRNYFVGDGKRKGGNADKRMLEKLKQVARRAGLNCGNCRGTVRRKAVTCKDHAICKQWGLHKFRHTYATCMLRDKVDIVTVSRWLGHKDLMTTRIYLRALDAEAAQPQVERSTLATQFTGRAPAQTQKKRASRVEA